MDKINYSPHGEYQLPNLTLEPAPMEPLGKYGLMRKNYLKQHREIHYNTMLMEGTLPAHLQEIEQTAASRMEQMMRELAEKNPPPEKTTDQMGWVGHMNNLRHQAEEVIQAELIYN